MIGKWYIKISIIIHIVKFTGPILEDLAKIATLVFDQVVMEEVKVVWWGFLVSLLMLTVFD